MNGHASSDDSRTPSPSASPVVAITHGNPTDDEAAAVVVALVAASAGTPVPRDDLGDRPRAGGWKSYWRVVRRPLVPGRDGWRNALGR